MLKELLKPEIQELIGQKNWKALKEFLPFWSVPDIADLLESLEDEDTVILFRLLSSPLASDVFAQLTTEKQKHLLKNLSSEKVKEIILELSPDDRTEIFEELPGKVVAELLNLLPLDERKEALQLLGYPEESVGRLMTPDYVAIRFHWTVKQALEHIRQRGQDAETIDIVYVVDEEGRLIDDVPLRRLVLAEPLEKVEFITDKEFVAISPFADQEEAVKIMKKYDLIALPVVDSQNVLLGIVTVDDILDVLDEEVTEDIQKRAGVMPLDMSYTNAPILTLFKKRIVWLSLLAVAGFLSSNVIAAFEGILTKIIALSFFIPVLIDSGGNTSSQSATLVIRAMAVGELTPKKWFGVIKKEILIGLLLGGALFCVLFFWSYFWRGELKISLIVGLSVSAITLWANLIGGLLPIIITKFKLDPAIVSSPLLTTILDVTGLLIYFIIAILLL